MNFLNFLPKSSVIANLLQYNSARWGHTLRGKRPGIARSLAQRLQDERVVDEELERKIDIGFPKLRTSRAQLLQNRISHIKAQRSNPELEKLARLRKLEIDLEEVKREWLHTTGPHHIMKLAKHFGIYEHLFGLAYFMPLVPMEVKFDGGEGDLCHAVYYGNIIKPRFTEKAPTVDFDASFNRGLKGVTEKSLWTLVLTNPDGNLYDSEKEVVHWMVANIEGNNVTAGETIVPYFRAFPPKGSGYHRHVFVLYKQEQKIDLNAFKIQESESMEKRTFSTLDFYRKFQDQLTPTGLCFFQSDYDLSVQKVFHETLKTTEPIYEYDFPEPYIADQLYFPIKKPFNLYMDKYRDPKQINKEYLERKLATTHPFDGPAPKLKYPNAHPIKNCPSWLLTEKQKDRLGWGRVNDIE